VTVSVENTAKTLGSGSLDVFATPALVALMEKAACAAIAGCLNDTETTVGAEVNVKHVSPTPIGLEVTAQAVVTEAGDNKCVFRITAQETGGKVIGEGTHTRVLVNVDKFMAKANAKVQ
jgi:uncharacterized protein (TIGR00369 family)